MADLYPDLPFLPDTPDRPRYRPLASTLGDLRYSHDSFPDLLVEIDIALDNHGQEMFKVGTRPYIDSAFRKK